MDAADTLRAGDRRMHGMTSQVWISDQQMQVTCWILFHKDNKETIVVVHYIPGKYIGEPRKVNSSIKVKVKI